MSSATTTTLTFTGNTSGLEAAFNRVGQSTRDMTQRVDDASDAFDRAGEASDTVDTRAMGFRDTLTGLQDGFTGLRQVASGDLGFSSLLALGFGVGDLASGLTNFLIPGLKSSVAWLKAGELGTLAHTVATKAAAIGSKVWAAGQWLLNAALSANPIGIVVIAIVALVAAIVIAWKNSETFRKVVIGAWNGIKSAALAVGRWFTDTLWPWIRGFIIGFSEGMRSIPSKIKSAFSGLWSIITSPFRAAFNWIADAWNNTIGRLHWSVPDWVPGVGGNSISVPHLPHFHSGGVVPGPPGQEVLAVLQGGETVSRRGQDQAVTIRIVSDGTRIGDALAEVLDRSVRTRGIMIGATRG